MGLLGDFCRSSANFLSHVLLQVAQKAQGEVQIVRWNESSEPLPANPAEELDSVRKEVEPFFIWTKSEKRSKRLCHENCYNLIATVQYRFIDIV